MNLIFSFLWSIFFPSNLDRDIRSSFLSKDALPLQLTFPNGKCVAQTFCLYASVDSSGENLDFTVHSIAKGWASFGISETSSMMNATVFVSWKNSSNGYVISDRLATNYIMPLETANQNSSVIPLQIPLPDWANMGVSFKRPIETRDVVFAKTSSFIYAFSNTPPLGNVDVTSVKFRMHGVSDCGSFGTIDFVSPPVIPITAASSTIAAPSPTQTTSDNLSKSKCAPEKNTYCIYGEPDDTNMNMIFTIHSNAKGWAAIGTGDDMSSSSMTIGWLNSQGDYTISDRHSNEEAMPSVLPNMISSLVSLKVPKPSWANMAFSFSKPIQSQDITLTSQTHYIFAYSSNPPLTIDSPTSSFSIHEKFGSLGAVNFFNKKSDPTTSALPTPSPVAPVISGVGDATSKCIPNLLCIFGEPDGKGNILITIHSAAKGWVGMGIGTSMSNSAIIVGWKNSQGEYVISDRAGTSRSLPGLATTISQLVPLKYPAPSWANLAYTVSRPLKSTSSAITSSSSYIYAFSDRSPSNRDSASSSFPKHSSAGLFDVLDFTTAKGISKFIPPASASNAGRIINQNTGVGSTCVNNLYCVYSEPDGNGNVYITLMGAAKGWVGLGTGDSMDNSFMIVGWANSSGGYTISDRVSKESIMPSPSPSVITHLVPLRVEKPSWAILAFTVIRPLKSDAVTFTATSKFIYAYSNSIPSSVDSATSNFAIHTGRGQLGVLDFTTIHKGIGSGGNSNDNNDNSTIGGDVTPTFDGSLLGSICIPNQFCVYSDPDDKGNVFITLQSSSSGWVGLGTGNSMAGSFMIIGWKNSTGGYTISDRVASGEIMPTNAPSQSSELVPLRVPAPSWAQIAFTVLRPLKTSEFIFIPSTNFIYGVSGRAPSGIDNVDSSFQIHDRFGKLGNLDFTTRHSGVGSAGAGDSPILQLPDGVEYSTVIRIHGYVMIYAWVVCPFSAIFIARYLKSALGHLWFELHRGIMLVGCFLGSVGGILMIFLFKSGPHFSVTNSLHPLLGLLVGIVLVIQIGLGIASDKLFYPGRLSVPWWDRAHWWVGRMVCLVAIVNIITGIIFADHFNSYALALPVSFGLFMAAGIAAFVYGEKFYGQVHHIKMKDDEIQGSIENGHRDQEETVVDL